jgi:predicted HicB family RNase H-like nuclease
MRKSDDKDVKVRMSPAMHRKLKMRAAAQSVSMAAMIRLLIRAGLAKGRDGGS